MSNPCSYGNVELEACSNCLFKWLWSPPGLHRIWSLKAFDFSSLDLDGNPAREWDRYRAFTVPRFEYSVTNSRDKYDGVERVRRPGFCHTLVCDLS